MSVNEVLEFSRFDVSMMSVWKLASYLICKKIALGIGDLVLFKVLNRASVVFFIIVFANCYQRPLILILNIFFRVKFSL